MKQLYQNSRGHYQIIRDEGCKYIDIANIFQDLSGYGFSAKEVNQIYDLANRAIIIDIHGKETPFMDKGCFVYNVSGLSSIMSGVAEKNIYIAEVEKYEDHNYRLAEMEYTPPAGKTVRHFVEVALDSDKVLRDPWKGGSRTARLGKIISYRYIWGEVL